MSGRSEVGQVGHPGTHGQLSHPLGGSRSGVGHWDRWDTSLKEVSHCPTPLTPSTFEETFPSGSCLAAGRLGEHAPASASPADQVGDETGEYEERAAIREFDGGLPRVVAERLAWADVLSARRLAGNQSIEIKRAS